MDRSIDADKVVTVLERLALERGGPPTFPRSDNGPEFIASAVANWCCLGGTQTVFTDPARLAEHLDRNIQRAPTR